MYANRLNLGKVRADENALWSLGPHDISVINFLTGEEPLKRSAPAASATCSRASRTSSSATSSSPAGMIGHLHVSWLDPHKSRKITVVGSEKMVVFDDMETDRKVTVYDKGAVVPRVPVLRRVRQRCASATSTSRASPTTSRCGSSASTSSTACARAEQPLSDGRDGLNVVRVLEAMQLSLRDGGRPVKTAELRPPPPARPPPRPLPAAPAKVAAVKPSDLGHNLLLGDDVVVGADVTFGANVVVTTTPSIGDGCFIQDNVVLGKVPSLSPTSTAKRGRAAAAAPRRRLRRLHRRRPLSRLDARRALHRRRPGQRARALHARRARRRRPRHVRRERHAHRRLHQDPVATPTSPPTCAIEDHVFIAPNVHDHQRQLHGPHGEAPRPGEGSDHPPRRARRRRAPCCCRPSRSARRRSSPPASVVTRDVPPASWSWARRPRSLRDVPEDELLENQ